MTATPLLSVRNLAKHFGGVRAVDGVSFDLAPGERLALIGPNGAGKTTLFNLLSGLLPADSGSLSLAGQDITRLPPHRRLRRGLSRTFQIASPFRSLSLADNVALAAAARAGRPSWRCLTGLPRKAVAEARELLEAVGLDPDSKQPVSALAYGDQKRLELAIALAGQPRVLLMDEPMAGVPHGEREALMQLAASRMSGPEQALIFTEHDMAVVFGHATRIIVLAEGRLIADGAPREIAVNPAVQQVYLGEGGCTGTGMGSAP
jgi:branched-chain amino acid transport system ATP-binding protein